ncbi:MAG: nitroreductase family protein [Bacteroidota bacterium]
MNVLETILTRRSIRKYIDKDIPNEMVDQLLEAAMYAPTANNSQAWSFIVINERRLLNQLATIHPYAKMLKYAPLAILVCGDKQIEENEGYLSVNCAAATQNILLAAHALGIGSVWLGVYPRAERTQPISDLLNLPLQILPISLISLGWPDEKKPKPERFLKENIHYNDKW